MAKKTREAFYKLILYAVFSLLNSKVDTEVKSILGRADVVIKTKTDIFVLELKVDDTVENALAQKVSTTGASVTMGWPKWSGESRRFIAASRVVTTL